MCAGRARRKEDKHSTEEVEDAGESRRVTLEEGRVVSWVGRIFLLLVVLCTSSLQQSLFYAPSLLPLTPSSLPLPSLRLPPRPW